MEARGKLREYLVKGNSKQLAKFLKDFPGRSVDQRVNEELDSQGTTPLIQCAKACKEGKGEEDEYAECLILLLKYRAKVNTKSEDGRTALHWAAGCQTQRLADVLLAGGAEPRLLDKHGINCLQVAIKEGSTDNVKVVLAKRPELANERDEFGVPPVIFALQHGHGDLVRHLVEAGADVNAQEAKTLRTALHYALYTKRLKIFQFLLGHQPNLTKTDHRGTTIVHRASATQDKQYLESLVKLSSSPPDSLWTMADEEGYTPVMLACQNNNLDHLVILLEHGATVSDHDKYGRTALHHCVENQETACAELLLKTDTSLLNTPDNEGLTPLHMSAITGNTDMLRLLLKKGANLTCRDQEGHTVVHWATVSGHTECLELLIEHGADLSSPDNHQAAPIHYAAQVARGSASTSDKEDGTQVLRLLLHHKVPHDCVDKDGRQPLLWAASAGNPGACQVLVEAGADPDVVDNDGLTALHCAASRGHVACVETLATKCKANVDPVDRNNCTPLFYAITLGNTECAKSLTLLGAGTGHKDSKGRSPAHCAALKGSQEALVVLQKSHVDLWSPSQQGNYPIHEAAHGGHVDIVKFLLGLRNRKDVVDISNEDGRTCLHIAALTNNLNLCKLLLDAGANVNSVMKNKGKYYTPTDAAHLKGHRETGDYLSSKGGRKGSTVTNDAAIIIQRNLKLREQLRPYSPKHRPHSPKHRPYSPKRRVKSPKRREPNKLEVLSPEEGQVREEPETVHVEGENVKESDSKETTVSTSVSLQAKRKSDKSETNAKESDSKKTDNDIGKGNKGSTQTDNNVKTDEKSATTTPRKGILKSSNSKENSEPMGSSPSKSTKNNKSEPSAVNGVADATSHNSVDSGEFYRKDSQKDSHLAEPRCRSRLSKSSRFIAQEVQSSVRRYEEERRAVREYHQLRRAQIYTGPTYDVALFSSTYNQNHTHDTFDSHDGGGDKRSSSSQWSDHTNGETNHLSRIDDHTQMKGSGKKNKTKSDGNTTRQSTSRRSKKMNQKAKEDEEWQTAERQQKDKEVEELAQHTEQLFTDINTRAATSVETARQMNSQLKSSIDQENSRGKRSQQNGHGENEKKKSRRERQKDEQKRKAEDFHRLLLKAYKPDTFFMDDKGRDKFSLTRSRTQVSSPTPSRPISVYSKRSVPSSASHSRPARPSMTIMTSYGSRKVATGDSQALPLIDTKGNDDKSRQPKQNEKHSPSPPKESEV